MHQIRVTIVHQLGRFGGYAHTNSGGFATFDDAKESCDALEMAVGKLSRLILIADDGSEIALSEKILDECVMIFKIVDVTE